VKQERRGRELLFERGNKRGGRGGRDAAGGRGSTEFFLRLIGFFVSRRAGRPFSGGGFGALPADRTTKNEQKKARRESSPQGGPYSFSFTGGGGGGGENPTFFDGGPPYSPPRARPPPAGAVMKNFFFGDTERKKESRKRWKKKGDGERGYHKK